MSKRERFIVYGLILLSLVIGIWNLLVTDDNDSQISDNYSNLQEAQSNISELQTDMTRVKEILNQ